MARERRLGIPVPIPKAILTCEKVLKDEFTGLFTVIGIFTHVFVYEMPVLVGPFQLFLQFTGGHGEYHIRVDLYDRPSDVIIASDDTTVELDDTLEVATILLNLPQFEATREGRYEVELFANDESIGQSHVTITYESEEGGHEEEDEQATGE